MNEGSGVYVSVVIPVFNERDGLKELCGELTKVMTGMGRDYEIIFVDDGSSDGSLGLLKELERNDRHVRVMAFIRNFGQHAAVMAGFNFSKGEIIVTLDADLQNPPQEIPKLIGKIEEGYDVASGWRRARKDAFSRKMISSLVNKTISRLTGVKLHDYGCMLRAYRRTIIEHLLQYGGRSVYIPAFTSWLSQNGIEVPVGHNPRKFGKSKYRFLKFLRQFFDLITAYTLLPIQLMSIVGAGFSVIGVLMAAYLISFKIFFGTPIRLATLISAFLFFFGVLILFMGITSEYLVRVSMETRKSPLYILRDNPGGDAPAAEDPGSGGTHFSL